MTSSVFGSMICIGRNHALHPENKSLSDETEDVVDATEDIANCTWAFATSGHAHPEIFAGPKIRSRCWIAVGATGPTCSRVKVSIEQARLVLQFFCSQPLAVCFNGSHPFIQG